MGFRTNSAQLYRLEHAKEVNTRNTDAEYLYGELEKRGIPAIIMEPLLGRRLSNVHDHIAAQLKQRRPESSVASWAFRFAGSFLDVLTVLSGMTYMEHLQDNLSTYSPFEELTSEEKEFLEETARQLLRYPTIPCNDCKYCMPCPYGRIFRVSYSISTNASTKAICPLRHGIRTIAKPAEHFLLVTTVLFRTCDRLTIVSAAINAIPIVRKISISPHNCDVSINLSRI